MLLKEISLADLELLNKAIKAVGVQLIWDKLPPYAYNADALREAVTLYNWALKENGGNFVDQYRCLGILVSTRSMPGVTGAMRPLIQTGFALRSRLVNEFHANAVTRDTSRFRSSRPDAIAYIKAVRTLFQILKTLGDIAGGSDRFGDADGLSKTLAKGTLKKLGVEGENLQVTAW